MELQLDFSQFLTNTGLYLFVAMFIGMSQAAGLGGGPILNITLMLGMGYTTKKSMAITYIFLLGGTLASIYSNYGKRNKANTKNLIDENLVIMTLPMTVSGSIIGALLNHYISELVITICFTVLIAQLAFNSYDKFKDSLRKREGRQPLLNQQQMISLSDSDRQSRVTRQTLKDMPHQLQLIVAEQLIPMRWSQILLFIQIIVIALLAMLIKGGTTFDSIIGFPKCGWQSQIVVFVFIAISYIYARHIFKKQLLSDVRKEELSFVFKKEQDKMSVKYFQRSLFVGFFAGCIGGMLGVGGSIILIPVWLDSGIDKDIATSSTAPLIFSSAFISMFIAMLCNMYESFGMVIFHFILAFLASFYIKKFVNWIKEVYKMEGIVFLLLLVMMIASLVVLLPFQINKMLKNPPKFFAFGEFC